MPWRSTLRKKLRREVKAGAPGLHREVTRLGKELSQALAEPSAAATQARKDRIAALEAENLQLRKTVHTLESHRETIRWQHGEIVRHVAELRRLRDQSEKVRSLSAELSRVHLSLEASKHERGKLTARLAKIPRARGDVVEIAVRRGRSPAQCASQVATPEDHDHPAAQGERPAA